MDEPIEIWGDGNIIRDYIYVLDVIEVCLQVIWYTGEERIFNVGSGKGYSLKQLVDEIQRISEKSMDVRYLPGRS